MIYHAVGTVTDVLVGRDISNDLNIGNIKMEKLRYIKSIVDNTFSIFEAINDINYIIDIISNIHPNSLSTDESLNSEVIFGMNYHLKNYNIRISTLLDLVKNLINSTFNTGISNKKCTIELLKDISYIKEHSSVKHLIKIQKEVEEPRTIRNKVIHHGVFRDDKINHILNLTLIKGPFKKPEYDIAKIDKIINENLKKLTFSMIEKTSIINTDIKHIFDSLVGVYHSKIKVFEP